MGIDVFSTTFLKKINKITKNFFMWVFHGMIFHKYFFQYSDL